MSTWRYQPPAEALHVVHHDRDVIVVDKPSGLLSVPGRGADLADCAQTRAQALAGTPVYAVHRLDLDTSGLLVFATRRKAERELFRQFREREVHKRYIAVAQGILVPSEGKMDQPLRRLEGTPRSVVCSTDGRTALTRYRRVHHTPDRSWVWLYPETGRSHQLRVHLDALGHPILGDRFYGTPASQAAAPRLMLHAERLRLRHPHSAEPMEFRAPVPSSFGMP